jgi:hypothetical protein
MTTPVVLNVDIWAKKGFAVESDVTGNDLIACSFAFPFARAFGSSSGKYKHIRINSMTLSSFNLWIAGENESQEYNDRQELTF